MPAVEHGFLDPVPERLYVDTDIFVNHLVAGQPHHTRCRVFLERLQREARTTLYVSSLSWLEVAHVITRPGFREALPDELQRRYRIGRWQRPDIRRAYIDGLLGDFESVLGQFAWVEVPLTPMVRRLTTRFMAEYGLGSQDAAHLASAAQEGVVDFASLDVAFRRVDDLDLWNDLIHRPRTT
ncbi:MAG: type II toxin-antitoxin system VapC family toxin [Chloroflexota bacterium]